MFESYSFEICQNTITDKLFLVCFQIISVKSDFSLNPGPVKILRVVQTQANLFFKSMSEIVGSDIERF